MKKKIKIKINHHDHDNGRFQTHQPKWPSRPSGLISSSANLASKQVSKKSSALKKLKNNIDCHNKVCTAKGPRDRRVRLSAHTAIQFYDVQDRLRYGRPSEAIDWLMKEAKTAIDALHELPSSDDKKPEQDQHFNEEDPINSLMSFRSQSHGFYLSLLQSCQNPNWFNPQTLFSASASLDFEPTPTNWSNPQTLNQFLSQGGTLQSSYPPSIPNSMNLNYDQMPGTGGNLFTGDGFSGFLVSPRSRGEEEKEKENPVPNKPSSASATCLLHY